VSDVTRTYVVTGSASGIGRATCELLASRGHRVIDVDLRDASITTDLGTAEGRASLVDEVRHATGGRIDAIVANAGVNGDPELCVRVNFFGAVATLVGLRPLLEGSLAPRAVATASSSVINAFDPTTLDACLAGDEDAAVAAAARIGLAGYPTSKRALARWVRRQAPTTSWAGAGIGLNAVAPGVVQTPMTAPLLEDAGMVELIEAAVPMPYGGQARPEQIAHLIAFLADGATERTMGQVVFVDAGADVVLRGDDIWGEPV
jgi:NAD(P)-dependent dehydrogenase (short-subunit alcohol dehydrogenase family)